MRIEDLIDYIIPIVFFIIYFGGALFGKRKQGEAPSERDIPDVFPGEGDLTRKIQQEIQRKIREKNKSHERSVESFKPMTQSQVAVDYEEQIMSHRKKAAEAREQIRKLKNNPIDAYSQEEKIADVISYDAGIRNLVGNRGSLRKAIVLREVLGKPIALRHS